MRARRRIALLAPLTGFLLVFFVAPLAWLLSLAVREAEVPRALPRSFAAVQRARGPLSAYYLLASVDLARDAQGRIERAPESNRIYVDVLLRTVSISATVTVLCLLLGFPVALLLTQVRDRTADLLMVLVLLPFWTSLLVRTAAWVVLLQREGIVNGALMRLGLIAEPLTLIYN